MSKGNILLCAGGTGGHLFPAEAVAHEMKSRGYTVHLAADERVERFAGNFPAEEIHQIRSATFSSKNPIGMAKTLFTLFSGYVESRRLIKKLSPVVVAGFGGYPTVPPLLAASRLKVPTLVHESNAVLGRANRFLTGRVSKVAIGFGKTNKVGGIDVTVTGNPVRPAVLEAARKDYKTPIAGKPFKLLVFGGSQGAAYFSDALPKACSLLSKEQRKRLRIVQQARPEDKEALINAFANLGIKAEVETFFTDMASRISDAHLVISRAGASTVSELAVIGRPAILVPYPHALDHDQATNAATVAAEGGAVIFHQSALTPDVLSDELSSAMSEPKRLALAAKNAKKTGKPDAAHVLADMLEALIEDKN
ncbi:MAG: undecaprenyldiphospho-muramoylpentapeptide beta-N-acetylglucosaminyltransferase [Pseudomonadota bacterium]